MALYTKSRDDQYSTSTTYQRTNSNNHTFSDVLDIHFSGIPVDISNQVSIIWMLVAFAVGILVVEGQTTILGWDTGSSIRTGSDCGYKPTINGPGQSGTIDVSITVT